MTAMALAGQPEILLADEPTSALDKVLEQQILELLDRQRIQRGLGILYITHNLASVAAFADRVLVMDAGVIVESGTTETVLAAPGPLTRAGSSKRPTWRPPASRLPRPTSAAPLR